MNLSKEQVILREQIREMTREVYSLERTQEELLRQILELQKQCSHTNVEGESLRKRTGYNGMKDTWECGVCGKQMK